MKHRKPDSVKRLERTATASDNPVSYTQALEELCILKSEMSGVKRERWREMV